jgi:hypothetical protein
MTSSDQLQMDFDIDADMSVRQPVVVAPPYEHLGTFITSEVQFSLRNADNFIGFLSDVAEGREPEFEEAMHGFTAHVGRERTKIWCTYFPDMDRFEIPTTLLIEAIRRYRQALLDAGCTR